MRASLPLVSGEATIAGLEGAVRVDRDALGVPTIVGDRVRTPRARSGLSTHRTGFSDGSAAPATGRELAALVGARALVVDEEARNHRLRDVARRALGRPQRRIAPCSRPTPKA